MGKKVGKGLEELNQYFQRDSELKHSKDMRGIQNSLNELKKLQQEEPNKENLNKQVEITSSLLETCSTYIRKNDKKSKRAPENESVSDKKKLDAAKSVLAWITDDVAAKNLDEKIKGASLEPKAKFYLRGRFRKLEANAKRAEKSIREFKWMNRKEHGYVKSVKKSDKVKQTSLSDLMKDLKDKDISAQPKKEQSTFKTASVSQRAREQAKGKNGVQLGAHREKDNSFKAELDRTKERKTNLKLGAHREAAKTDTLVKKDAAKGGRQI